MDGTLIDSSEAKAEAFTFAFRDIPDSRATVKALHQQYGGTPRSQKIKLISRSLLNFDEATDVLERRMADFVRSLHLTSLTIPSMPGAHEVLTELSATAKQVLVTAAPIEEAEPMLQRHQLLGYFTKIYGFPTSKVEAVSEFRTSNSGAIGSVLVGDSEQDYLAAAEVNIPFIHLRTHGEASFEHQGVSADSLEDVPGVIRSMFS